MLRFFWMSFFFNLFLSSSWALTPAEIVTLAQQNAPAIKAFVAGRDSSQLSLKQARTLSNPVLTFQGGEVKTGEDRGSVLDFTLMQPLPWPGRRELRIKEKEFYLKISELDLDQVKLELAHRAYLLCYELAAISTIQEHNKERRERFNLISRFLASRPIASPKQVLEKDLVLSQLRLLEKLMNEVTLHRKSLERELELLTGVRNPKVKVDWKNLPRVQSREEYLANLDNSLIFKKMIQKKKISQSRVEAASLEARPDILVGVNYRQERLRPMNEFYHGQISIVIPILDNGQYSVEKAKADLKRKEVELQILELETRKDLVNMVDKLEAAKSNLNLFPLSLPSLSEKSFLKADAAFRKGQIDVMTFIQSDSQLHENIHAVFNIRIEYLSLLSELGILTGKQLEF